MSENYVFTSESVTEGHPDFMADIISDSILDACLSLDKESRVACETMVKTGSVIVAGEITTEAYVNIPEVVRKAVSDIGYDNDAVGFNGKTCAVLSQIEGQSPDISQGVTEGEGLCVEQGAGDQGMMFGYACDETDEFMPLPIAMAHGLTRRMAEMRRSGMDWMYPDGKSQVTVKYENGKPTTVDTIVVSTHHAAHMTLEDIREEIVKSIIDPVCGHDIDTRVYVNPTGLFTIGGPVGDCGLTGRKIIVDTYGGMGRHGGGAFSGKDPSKVDRSGAYAARAIAKNIVMAGFASRCEVQLAYAIGIAEPVGIYLNTFGTGKVDEVKLMKLIPEIFAVKPKDIISTYGLKNPIYTETAKNGHFGNPNFPWESFNCVEDLKGCF